MFNEKKKKKTEENKLLHKKLIQQGVLDTNLYDTDAYIRSVSKLFICHRKSIYQHMFNE